MIYSIVDVLLGGRRGTAAMRIEGRPYTTIERTLVERLIQVVLADLSASFDPLCPVTFRFERLEVNPRFATISRLSNAAVLARLRIDMEDRGGRMELLLPYATLEPVRELLLQQFMGEKFGRDSIWETHLAEELWNTEVELDVVLDEQMMRLSDVMALQPGSRIVLNTALGAPVLVRCGAVPLVRRPRRPPQEPRRGPHRARGAAAPADASGSTVIGSFLTLPRDNAPHGVDARNRPGRAACGDAVSRRPAGTRAGRAEARPRGSCRSWSPASTPARARRKSASSGCAPRPTAPASRSPSRSMRRCR